MLLLGLLCLTGTSTFATGPSDMQKLVDGNSTFALELYHSLTNSMEGNLVFSPYSISTALGMVYAGARGDTETQMAQTLHFTLPQDRLHEAFQQLQQEREQLVSGGDVELKVANSLWPQTGYPFLGDYIRLLEKDYGVWVTPLDYTGDAETARNIINEWVNQRLNGRIPELIARGMLDPLTRLVLVNTIFVHADWRFPFSNEKTKEQPFFVSPGQAVSAEMMYQQNTFRYAASEGVQVLELPYRGNSLSMLVVLPNQQMGLTGLQRLLSLEELRKWEGQLSSQKVDVYLPKFHGDSKLGLNEVLASMGMQDAFDASRADFSGMDGRVGWLYISQVIHQAFIDVEERGTEAGAATAVIMSRSTAFGPTSSPVEFRADHPFLFLIRENSTGSILFLGHVVDPTLE